VSDVEQTYGPDALYTPANVITILRLLIAPLLFSMITSQKSSWMVFVLWVALGSTDGIDERFGSHRTRSDLNSGMLGCQIHRCF